MIKVTIAILSEEDRATSRLSMVISKIIHNRLKQGVVLKNLRFLHLRNRNHNGVPIKTTNHPQKLRISIRTKVVSIMDKMGSADSSIEKWHQHRLSHSIRKKINAQKALMQIGTMMLTIILTGSIKIWLASKIKQNKATSILLQQQIIKMMSSKKYGIENFNKFHTVIFLSK